jgi:hypothetical protein
MTTYEKRHEKYYIENKEIINEKARIKTKITLQLSGLTFKFKKDLEKYVKEEICKYIDKEINRDHQFYNTLLDIFHRNPKYEKCNPSSFILISSKNRSESPGLSKDLRRGETYRPHFKTDIWRVFSLKGCLTVDEKTDKSKTIRALRDEIKEQINEYRRNNSSCVRCGSKDKLEVDHVKTFKSLSESFLKICSDELGSISICKRGIYYCISDEIVKQRWLDFHKENCILQSLCKSCHKKKTHEK